MSTPHIYTVIRTDNDRHRKNKYTSRLIARDNVSEEQDVLRPLGMRLSSPESVHNRIFHPSYKALCLRPLYMMKSRASLPNIIPNRLFNRIFFPLLHSWLYHFYIRVWHYSINNSTFLINHHKCIFPFWKLLSTLAVQLQPSTNHVLACFTVPLVNSNQHPKRSRISFLLFCLDYYKL